MNNSEIEETLCTSDEGVKRILSTILNLNMWNEISERVLVSAINKLLSVARSRLQGLEYLNLVITNCSATIIFENGITWISNCLIKYPRDNLKELKLTTIGKVVDNCFRDQEFSKKFVSEYISKVLEICLSTQSNFNETSAALETLAICMKHYGSWFTPHKLRIESFVIKFLENTSEQIVENAAVSFHYVQQIGGAGTDGINHKTSFSTSFDKLCATVQKLFDKYLENEAEIDQEDRPNQETFEFLDLPHHTQQMLHVTAKRIKNCLKFITTMLLKGFPVEKEIKPGVVLNIIVRGCSIHHCLTTENRNSVENYQFSILLSQIQIDLLRLLHVLIIWLQGNALPFTFAITKVLIDCLNKCQNCQCFKTHSVYQETVYKVLRCWIRVAKGAVHSHFQTQLIKCILKDITPIKSGITLNLQNDIAKNKSKKTIQKAIQERIISSGQGNTSTEELTNMEKSNREIKCILALDTLKHLLIGTILKLQANTMQELYMSIINTLIEIQTSKTRHPYTNPECEATLYEVLVTFYEQDTLNILPPLQLTITIFNKGLNSNNRKIALACENGLNMLEKLCQPICPSLYISDKTILKEGTKEVTSFVDDKVVKVILGENDEIDDVNKPTANEERISCTTLNIPEVETRTPGAEEVPEESVGNVTNGNGPLLMKEETSSSIRIIDVQIIKSSSTEESQEMLDDDILEINDGEYRITEDEQVLDIKVSPTKIKAEVLSNSQEINECKKTAECTENGEPPLKKIRTEEEVSTKVENVIKKEELSINLDDDIFQEDDFVDEVKEY